MGSSRGGVGGWAGAVGGLKDLKESDKSCKGVSHHDLHLGKPRAADSIASRIPPCRFFSLTCFVLLGVSGWFGGSGLFV